MAKRPSQKEMASLADQLGPEDGIDPRLIRPNLEGRTVRRNTLQLCSQVSRALSVSLAACADDVLRDLQIVGVVPAAGAGRLLVTVARSPAAELLEEAVIQARLHKAAALFRAEVAAAVHRRRAPELIFRLARDSREA